MNIYVCACVYIHYNLAAGVRLLKWTVETAGIVYDMERCCMMGKDKVIPMMIYAATWGGYRAITYETNWAETDDLNWS